MDSSRYTKSQGYSRAGRSLRALALARGFLKTIWGKGDILKEDMDTFFELEEGADCIPLVPS